MLLISPLPTVASTIESQFAALRSALLYPFLIILIGIGISVTFFLYRNNKYRIFISVLLISLYGIQILNFINIYFFRNPIYNSEAYNLSSRITSKYISIAANNGKKVTVISDSPKTNFKHYLFETNSYNIENAGQIKNLINQSYFKLNNATFITCSGQSIIPKDHTIIAVVGKKCTDIDFSETDNTLIISQLSDGGAIFRIVNDIICKKYNLGRFPRDISISDFSIESLSEKHFCEKYISNPNNQQ